MPVIGVEFGTVAGRSKCITGKLSRGLAPPNSRTIDVILVHVLTCCRLRQHTVWRGIVFRSLRTGSRAWRARPEPTPSRGPGGRVRPGE